MKQARGKKEHPAKVLVETAAAQRLRQQQLHLKDPRSYTEIRSVTGLDAR